MASLDEWIKDLDLRKKQYPKIGLRIANRLADEMIKNVYPDTVKVPAKLEGNIATVGIKNMQEKWTYHEYGTGIVGSQNPHVAEALQQAGWKYDVNNHGEKGWIYPVENGEYRWTKGQPASKEFWKALEKAEGLFPKIAREEFLREVGR